MNCYIWSRGRKIILKEKIMSNKNLRNAIRIIHLIAAATLGMYFYSPIAGDETLRLIIQFVTLHCFDGYRTLAASLPEQTAQSQHTQIGGKLCAAPHAYGLVRRKFSTYLACVF